MNYKEIAHDIILSLELPEVHGENGYRFAYEIVHHKNQARDFIYKAHNEVCLLPCGIVAAAAVYQNMVHFWHLV